MLGRRPAVQLPFYFLAAFAFELTLKAVVCAQGGKARDLRVLGHDLRKALAAAKRCGYVVPEGFGIEAIIYVLSDGHRQLEYRYIPAEREILTAAKPDALVLALRMHIEAIEAQFDVWSNTELQR